LLRQVSPEAFEIGAKLVERPPSRVVVQLHVGHRRQVKVGAFELADRCPRDLAPFVGGPDSRQLNDGVAHDFNLGGRL
jgi:hypothetical protein